jgi:hypothetical protein
MIIVVMLLVTVGIYQDQVSYIGTQFTVTLGLLMMVFSDVTFHEAAGGTKIREGHTASVFRVISLHWAECSLRS